MESWQVPVERAATAAAGSSGLVEPSSSNNDQQPNGMANLGSSQQTNCLALHSLIDYVPLDKPAQFNQSQVATNRFNSVFYMHDVDELDVIEVCRLLAYYLRARFDVKFDREPRTADEMAGHNLFYSLKDFHSYYEAFKVFLRRMYETNQEIAARIDEFVAASEEELRNGGSGGGVAGSLLTEDSLSILRQFKDVRKVFSNCFAVFSSDRFDPGVLYERLFLERSCSAIVPLTIALDSIATLPAMFDQLCYLCIQSVDYCNSVMPAIVSAGVVVYSVLYLSGTEGKRDTDGAAPSSWGKVNSADSNGMPQWLHVEVDSAAYQHDVQHLPADLFDQQAGDTYVRNHDFIATLMTQTIYRLCTRLIEWPAREDVAVWMGNYFKCENMFRFFSEHGRNEQLWIRFRKRRQRDRKLPAVYVKLEQLTDMYNEVALATRKQGAKVSGQEHVGDPMADTAVDLLNGTSAAGRVALPPEKAVVRDRIEGLRVFKERYVRFWLNGIRQAAQNNNRHFHDMFAAICGQFILATGGFRGLDIAAHAADIGHVFSLEPDAVRMDPQLNGLTYAGCATCSDLLVPGSIREIFHLDHWLELVNDSIFPYNFLALTPTRVDDPVTLHEAVIYKMLEAFATRRLTSDRAKKMLDFFLEQRPVCQFVVTQHDMIGLWTKATNQLSFFKEFLGMPQE